MAAESPMERPLDPTKLMRIAATVREILDEARRREPTPDSANRLAELYKRVKVQLEEALPEFLANELDSLELDTPFEDGATVDEVRVAYSGLMGWLTGLFQGLQASFQAQQQLNMNEGQPALPDGQTQFSPGAKKPEGYL
jgi:proteasome activator-like protein